MEEDDCKLVLGPTCEEILSHDVTFPLICNSEDRKSLSFKYDVQWHWHEDFEVIVILAGIATVTAGSETITLKEGEGIFINSGVLHSVYAYNNAHFILRSLVFHPHLLASIDSVIYQKYLEPVIKNKCIESIYLKNDITWHKEVLQNILSAWSLYKEAKKGYEVFIRNELSEMLLNISLNQNITENKVNPKILRQSERIKKMLEYIQVHFQEEINLHVLSELIYASESEVLRSFRDTINTTPIQYLSQYRIQKASEMLKTTNLSSTEIAYECGFQSASYFIEVFKKIEKCTPLEYRKKNTNNE